MSSDYKMNICGGIKVVDTLYFVATAQSVKLIKKSERAPYTLNLLKTINTITTKIVIFVQQKQIGDECTTCRAAETALT